MDYVIMYLHYVHLPLSCIAYGIQLSNEFWLKQTAMTEIQRQDVDPVAIPLIVAVIWPLVSIGWLYDYGRRKSARAS